jgi:hypothetical protein
MTGLLPNPGGSLRRWFTDLPPNSIGSWQVFKDKFLRHFTSSKKQFKSEYHLKSVTQSDKDPLRDYIIRFYKEALEVKGVAPNMILFFLMEGLKPSFL